MMLLLILNVSAYFINVTKPIGKGTITFLPIKPMRHQVTIIYPRTTRQFYIFYKVWNSDDWFISDKNVNVVSHPIYSKHFTFVILNDTRNIFIQVIFPLFLNKTFTVFYRKYKLNI